ncbi:MAG TPA: DNA internalization-related competence protein ComEC/Rec2 [Bacillaceae bacterium]
MSGKWLYIALSGMAGVLAALESHVIVYFVFVCLAWKLYREKDMRLLLLAIMVFVMLLLAASIKNQSMSTIYPQGKADILIHFKEYPKIDGNRLQSIVETNANEKLQLMYTIRSEEEKALLMERLRAGSSCRLAGNLTLPDVNRNENAFNYRAYLFRQNIHWIFEPDSIPSHVCQDYPALVEKLKNIRASGIKKVQESFPSELVPYANALLFGDRTDFAEEAYESYKRLGVVHLLAISGLHVGLIAGAIRFLLLRFGLTRESAYWLLASFLPAYAVISGGNPPVVRAVIMALLLFSAQQWRWPVKALDAISASFILFLFYDPFVIYHAGFQLSYAVSFSLILSSPRLLANQTSYLALMWKISIISLLASLPILACHFYEFSVASLVANMVFVPFYTCVVLPSVFLLLFLLFLHPPLFSLCSKWLNALILLSEKGAALAAGQNGSVLTTGKPMAISLTGMVLAAMFFLVASEKGKGIVYAALPLILVLGWHMAAVKYSSKGEVVFIDVGQGDSILIKLPYGRGNYLIDTGGRLDFDVPEWQQRRKSFLVGRDIVVPLLKSKGITELDALILTHSDADHMGAAGELLGKLSIKEIHISPRSWEKPIMASFAEEAGHRGIQLLEARAGNGWQNKSGNFQYIYPFDDTYEGNNDSLVLYAVFGGLSWLFTGDLEKEGEEELASHSGSIRADVLKAGHHGSRTSTSPPFADKVNPVVAVISAGKNNRYGHPHPEVIETLERKGAAIYRTDEDGAVHYEFVRGRGTFRSILQYDEEKHIQNK